MTDSISSIPPVADIPAVTISESLVHPICGFWIRILALIIDSIILGLLGILLGLLFGDFFMSLGSWGRLVGFVIFVFYFGLLQGPFGNGQSLGKKICKIRV